MSTSSLVVTALLVVYVAKRVWVVLQASKTHVQLPTQLATIQPFSMVGAALPTTWWNLGLKFIWRDKDTLYKGAPLKTKKITPLFYGTTLVYSANLATFRQALGNNSAFHKPELAIKDLQFMGVNVIASEGDAWKRHRRIAAPAFNRTTYQNVWNTTAHVYKEVLDKEGWGGASEARIADVNKITRKLALFVVAIVGFGIPMSWNAPDRDASGRLSIQAMVFNVATSILLRSRTPRWAYALGIPKLARVDEAYNNFERLMIDRIAAREHELKEARALESDEDIEDGIRDVFGRLVNARLTEGRLALSDEEIIGNCFMIVFAGHETTANTLSAVIALLALYPEAQEWVYRSIKNVLGEREPTFDDYSSLEDVLACFYEALRLYPVAYLMYRQAHADTVLKLPRSDNPSIVENVPMPKGTNLVMDFVGMCYDESTFPDPEAFEPRRWSKSGSASNGHSATPTNKATQADEFNASAAATALEGFVGFSFGPRTCLGREFAKVEAVAFLTLLLRDWRVEVDLARDESRAAWRRRVLNPTFGVTMTFGNIPVRLIRRDA